MQQVLLNLLRNAIAAMEASERREPVVSTRPAADNMIVISVADTGPGIDPRVTTKRRGMGIGLSISSTIIESHGGQITMESAGADIVSWLSGSGALAGYCAA